MHFSELFTFLSGSYLDPGLGQSRCLYDVCGNSDGGEVTRY